MSDLTLTCRDVMYFTPPFFLLLVIAGQLFMQWRFQKSEIPTRRMAKPLIKEF